MHGVVSGEYGIVTDPHFAISEKGNAWMRLRLVSKKRKRDDSGNWIDADPCFINGMVNGKLAEHLFESVTKGDTILIQGELGMREYEVDGSKRQEHFISINSAAVSVKWHPVTRKNVSIDAVKDALGATEVDTTAPF